MKTSSREKSYSRISYSYTLPRLIEMQLESFEWLKNEGLAELFDEISPIVSFNGGMQLYFPGDTPESKEFGLKYWFMEPKWNQAECLDRDLTYSSPLYVKVLLVGEDVPEPITSDIFLGDFPIMTEEGTFIVNGTERVVVSQLIRSPGVYFEAQTDPVSGRKMSTAKLVPDRGAWMEFETKKSDYLTVKFNRKRTIPVTVLLRAMAAIDDGMEKPLINSGEDEEIFKIFGKSDNDPERQYMLSTMKQEPEWDLSRNRTVAEEALIEFFRRMRPGDPAVYE